MYPKLRIALFGAVCASVLLSRAAFAGTVFSDTNGDGSINVGSAKLFTTLARGDMTSYDNNITGPSLVVGNVGIGGKGNFSMSDGQIQGDIYMNDTGTFSMSGPANITGHKHGRPQGYQSYGFDGISQQSLLDAAVSDISDSLGGLSYAAAHDTVSPSSAYTVNGSHTTLTNVNLNSSGNTVVADSSVLGSKIVLNLQNFVMTQGTFTLQGTAMTTFILNISQNFSLNNSKIVLSGGLLASHVLYNVIGTGGDVNMQQGTSAQGVMLAYNRKLDLSGGKIFGRAIANQIVITSGGQVVSQ